MINENTKIKEWYIKEFPTDEAGKYIEPEITFYGLFELLDTYQDVYPYLAEDSVVRERCFTKLAELMNISYDEIYAQWMMGNDRRN